MLLGWLVLYILNINSIATRLLERNICSRHRQQYCWFPSNTTIAMYFHVVYFPKQILEIRGEIWNDTYWIRFLINVNLIHISMANKTVQFSKLMSFALFIRSEMILFAENALRFSRILKPTYGILNFCQVSKTRNDYVLAILQLWNVIR